MKLRDPDRIPKMLELVGEAWARNPQLRLGQLLLNHVRPSAPCPELYYIEDDNLLEVLGVHGSPPVWEDGDRR